MDKDQFPYRKYFEGSDLDTCVSAWKVSNKDTIIIFDFLRYDTSKQTALQISDGEKTRIEFFFIEDDKRGLIFMDIISERALIFETRFLSQFQIVLVGDGSRTVLTKCPVPSEYRAL